MAKKFKTNALRMLDKAKIPYSIKEYEYDEEHLDGRHVASQVNMDPNAIFKTLVLHDHHNEHLVCCVPVLEEIDLKKLAKNGAIAVVDYDTYLDVASTTLKDYSPRYTNSLNIPYTFKVREDNAFTKLFKAYISLSDASMIRVEGLNSYKKTLDSGTILGTIAKYILYFLIIFVILIYVLYKRARKKYETFDNN